MTATGSQGRRGFAPFAVAVGLCVAVLAAAIPMSSGHAETAVSSAAAVAYEPVTVRHALGETVVSRRPERVAALDMNELDFLDQLGVPVAGIAKDYVPHFLSRYRDDPQVADLGFIVKPNVERVHALKPDLILITSLQAAQYREMSRFAPVIHFDVDYRDSHNGHIQTIKDHLETLGRLFGKEERAARKSAELDQTVARVQAVTRDRPERALIVLHNNGSFSSFGLKSRYGFVFSDFGVGFAGGAPEAGLHGQPVTSEFLQAADPDILYVIDRTAVMERRAALTRDSIGNPLIRQTRAWKTDRVVFVDPEAWYVTAASPTSLRIIAEDVMSAYHR